MPDSPWLLVHTTEIPVRWCDMDAFGHVNNSVYFSYFEIARIGWWKIAAPEDTSFQTTGPVIVNASCTFFKPIVYPENLIVKLFVAPPGRSSYDCFYQIYSASQEILYAEGNTKVVWVDRDQGRSIPLPDYMRRLLPTS